MISDVLSEAVSEINRYLNDDVLSSVYNEDEDLLFEIYAVRNAMERLRKKLDTIPRPPK